MTTPRLPKTAQLRHSLRAFTLIEIAIVIAIITLLALGIAQSATYFRTAANKSLCIVVQKQIQDAMRSVENLDNLNVGTTSDGANTLSAVLFGTPSSYFPVTPSCPAGAAYTLLTSIPDVGTAFATCTTTTHAPTPAQLSSW